MSKKKRWLPISFHRDGDRVTNLVVLSERSLGQMVRLLFKIPAQTVDGGAARAARLHRHAVLTAVVSARVLVVARVGARSAVWRQHRCLCKITSGRVRFDTR